jgi:predicted Co/Zn/Cd cation transporter (cation efflux family)
MKKPSELTISAVLLAALFLKLDPFHWLMPTATQMGLLGVFAVAFALYAGAIFREKAQDERESLLLYRANRMGYLAGVVSISVVIVFQDLRHNLDPMLLLVLALMVVVKLMVLGYSRYRS